MALGNHLYGVRARDSHLSFFVCVEKLKHFKKVKKTIM